MNAIVVAKRVVAIILILILGLSSTAFADQQAGQPSVPNAAKAEELRRSGMYKLLAGAGIATIGALLVAGSHESATVTTPGIGTITASATNTGAMVAGIGMLGGGGFLIYLGAKDRSAAKAGGSIGISVGRRRTVSFTRQW